MLATEENLRRQQEYYAKLHESQAAIRKGEAAAYECEQLRIAIQPKLVCLRCHSNTDFSRESLQTGYGQVEALCQVCVMTHKLKVVKVI